MPRPWFPFSDVADEDKHFADYTDTQVLDLVDDLSAHDDVLPADLVVEAGVRGFIVA